MSRPKQVEVYPEGALLVIAHFKDFDGDFQKWKDSFYELWRYQMTWSFAYELIVTESKKNGVFVRMVINRTYENPLLNTMEDLGYKDIKVSGAVVGVIEFLEFDGDYAECIVFE